MQRLSEMDVAGLNNARDRRYERRARDVIDSARGDTAAAPTLAVPANTVISDIVA
jgi:hypothetical protein